MAYQALYRTWRPQSFGDMVGQEAVQTTLRNAILNHKTSHAYLFTGPRGTGKTSAAKIFAKAINCPHSQNGEPCNQCDICQGITKGTIGDVIEIDAASNNGVEEIRDIREKARYAPTQAKYKVYIIDEVHMLSTGAFNALLKTLEEPPQNVIFLLATTEPHKIPATIISRTQRFDFKRISTDGLIARMAYILEAESIDYDERILPMVARIANGGMRDALSILDQIISFSQGKLTYEKAVQVSGALTDQMMIVYLREVFDGQVQAALKQLQSLLMEGKEASRLLEEWMEFCRDLLLAKETGASLGRTNDFLTFVDQVDVAFLYQMIEGLHQTQQNLRLSTKPTIALEVMTVRLATRPKQSQETSRPLEGTDVGQLQDLKDQLAAMQKELLALQGQARPAKPAPSRESRPRTGTYKPNVGAVYQILNQARREDLNRIHEIWQDLLHLLTPQHRALLDNSEPVAASPTGFVLKFDYEILCMRAEESAELHQAVKSHGERLAQYPADFVSVTQDQWVQLRKEFLLEKKQGQKEEGLTHATGQSLESVEETQEDNPVDKMLKDTLELFGQEIVEIKES